MNFKDIVEAVVRHQIVEGLIEGWDMTKKVEASRTPVLLLCNHYGIKKTLAKQADRIIQRWVENHRRMALLSLLVEWDLLSVTEKLRRYRR
jgi:hypothetical protein